MKKTFICTKGSSRVFRAQVYIGFSIHKPEDCVSNQNQYYSV